jgi:hypothetical protein
MSDLSISALVSRSLLGLEDLNINDHSKYVVAGPMVFGGAVQWNRRQVEAPWVDGSITVERHRQNVSEQLSVYVAGSSIGDLDTNLGALIAAMQQDRYTFQLVVGGANHAWDCEAADISQVLYDTTHVHNKYVTVTFSVPRKPIPLAGAF